MYLHLGQDYIVPLQNVVAVFDGYGNRVRPHAQRVLAASGRGAHH